MFSRRVRCANYLGDKIVLKCAVVLFLFQSVTAHRNPLSGGSDNGPSNYKDALLVYPTGIRSERDLPVCPSVAVEEDSGGRDRDVRPSFSPGLSSNAGYIGNDMSKLHQPSSTKNPSESSKKYEGRSLAACNIIHRRYFYPPMIERLCRCPDRTECPMEWSHPPQYKDFVRSDKKDESVSTTPSTKYENTMDPFTVMISSRSQLKFCTEVSMNLPACSKQSKQGKESSADENPSMVKTIRKTFIAPELPSVSVNCYCPPLYRRWSYLSKNEPTEHSNGTIEANYFYRCDKLEKCKAGQQCGTVRTDYHFSYYHCTCPKNHLCVPKVYPPLTIEDVEETEEALYSGQVAAAYCTPELL